MRHFGIIIKLIDNQLLSVFVHSILSRSLITKSAYKIIIKDYADPLIKIPYLTLKVTPKGACREIILVI